MAVGVDVVGSGISVVGMQGTPSSSSIARSRYECSVECTYLHYSLYHIYIYIVIVVLVMIIYVYRSAEFKFFSLPAHLDFLDLI